MPRRPRSLFPAALIAFAGIVLAAAVAAAEPRSQSFLVFVDGQHVGEARWEWRADGGFRETLRLEVAQLTGRSTAVDQLAIGRAGDGWTWTRRLETGTVERRTTGRIGAEQVAREAAVLPSQLADRIAESTGDERFVQLDAARKRLVDTALSPCPVATDLPGAARCVGLRTASGREAWHFDADGKLLRVDGAWSGLPLSLVACAGLGCQRRVAQPLDVVGRLVVASPVRFPRRLAQAKLRYVLAAEAGGAPTLPATGEQAVVQGDAETVVTVCADCGAPSVETDASLAPYRIANAWVRSDDARLRRVAERARLGNDTVDERMRALAAIVRQRMIKGTPEFLGYADAVQAWRTRRGDCTEYAVLLAALARAQGLPARVAVGMAYASRFTGHGNAFSPHAWVQVYDAGRWTSYDAAYESGMDSTHVALATGTGDPAEAFEAFRQLRGLRIGKVGEVR